MNPTGKQKHAAADEYHWNAHSTSKIHGRFPANTLSGLNCPVSQGLATHGFDSSGPAGLHQL